MKIFRSIMVCILALLVPISVHATEVSKGNVVSKNKVWTVKFNDIVDMSTVKGNIYVKDSKGNRVNLEVYSKDDKSVSVMPPNGQYEAGEKYVLYVDKGIKSKGGSALKQISQLEFMVKEYGEGENVDQRVKDAEVNITVYNYDNTILRTGKGYIIDSKIVTNYNVINDGAKADVTLKDGRKINIKSVINYNKSENIAVMTLEENGVPTLKSSIYAEVEKVGQLLPIKLTYDVINKRLIKEFEYSLIEVKKIEGSEPNFRFVEKSIKEYYGNVNGLSGVSLDGVYIEKNPNNSSMINVYLIMESKNTEALLGHVLSNESSKMNVENWIHTINQYITKNFIGYTIETKLNGEVKDKAIVDEINAAANNSFDYNQLTKIYTFKAPIVTHYEANGKGYYAWHHGLR